MQPTHPPRFRLRAPRFGGQVARRPLPARGARYNASRCWRAAPAAQAASAASASTRRSRRCSEALDGEDDTKLTVGFELASNAVHHEPFQSNASLLDWDIILFKPGIPDLWMYDAEQYQGKSCLSDAASFALKEATEHWRREIKQAMETGKTVVVFLPPLEEVFVATGEVRYEGTGRNARKIRSVSLHSNYRALPVNLDVTNGTGSAMKLASHGAHMIAPYWKDFGSISEYKVLLPMNTKGICLLTKHGDRPVGAILRPTGSTGAIVLLPDLDFYPEKFIQEKGDERVWNGEAKKFAARMISAFVALDKAIHASIEVTPEPTWVAESRFALVKELGLRSELLESERQVEEAQKRKEEVQERIKAAGQIRALLYEKGKPLENSIIEALRTLGFHAAAYKDAASEFDVVFESAEGRLLGEAEGKDDKAINIDKLRQLAMNINEDLRRDEVSSPAKGVLFGNGYRLSSPEKRDIQFTGKCVTAAKSSFTALVVTSDLFGAVQYLSEQADHDYAKQCRETILAGVRHSEITCSTEAF